MSTQTNINLIDLFNQLSDFHGKYGEFLKKIGANNLDEALQKFENMKIKQKELEDEIANLKNKDNESDEETDDSESDLDDDFWEKYRKIPTTNRLKNIEERTEMLAKRISDKIDEYYIIEYNDGMIFIDFDNYGSLWCDDWQFFFGDERKFNQNHPIISSGLIKKIADELNEFIQLNKEYYDYTYRDFSESESE